MADNNLRTLFITQVLVRIDSARLILCKESRIFHLPYIMV